MPEDWELKQVKAMCFAAGSTFKALEKCLDWLRPIEACFSILALTIASDGDRETITVFYEES